MAIKKEHRIALVGSNGCGKTTLLKMLLGKELVDQGAIKVSVNAKIAYLAQDVKFEDPDETVLALMRKSFPLTEEKARSILAQFQFKADSVLKQLRALSGGERSRLKLCLMMQEKINVLLLDEPTNHLDIASREWIEGALMDFSGAILFVSHDRYFLKQFADQVWHMEDGKITHYDCGYEAFLDLKDEIGK